MTLVVILLANLTTLSVAKLTSWKYMADTLKTSRLCVFPTILTQDFTELRNNRRHELRSIPNDRMGTLHYVAKPYCVHF